MQFPCDNCENKDAEFIAIVHEGNTWVEFICESCGGDDSGSNEEGAYSKSINNLPELLKEINDTFKHMKEDHVYDLKKKDDRIKELEGLVRNYEMYFDEKDQKKSDNLLNKGQ